jgi:hypothetical protein
VKKIVLTAMVLLFVATPAFAVGGETWTYYSNSNFTTVVGARYIPNPDNPSFPCVPEDEAWWWGQTSGFKKIQRWSECHELGPDGTTCYVFNGSNWQTVTCP